MATLKTPADFRETVYAFQASRIILTAYELELFTVLGNNERSSKEVALQIETNERATDRLMNALVSIGLLAKKDGVFRNLDFSLTYLVKGSPMYLTGYGHTLNMWHTWTGLTEAVRTGERVYTEGKDDPEWTRNFIAAMHHRARGQADAVVAKINLSEVENVLDVGGGSGVYSIAFVLAKEGLKCTVFDLPEVLINTNKYVKSAGLDNSISFIAGDYHTSDLGSGYDIIFLSAIVHINSHQENISLISRCTKALNPGGRIIIQDHVMQEDRTAPHHGAFFALNMLVATERGDTFTENEIKSWMENAGLTNIEIIPTFNNALVIGHCKNPAIDTISI